MHHPQKFILQACSLIGLKEPDHSNFPDSALFSKEKDDFYVQYRGDEGMDFYAGYLKETDAYYAKIVFDEIKKFEKYGIDHVLGKALWFNGLMKKQFRFSTNKNQHIVLNLVSSESSQCDLESFSKNIYDLFYYGFTWMEKIKEISKNPQPDQARLHPNSQKIQNPGLANLMRRAEESAASSL